MKLHDSTFNPHFLSMTFETIVITSGTGSVRTFNPHFLSMTFETQKAGVITDAVNGFQSSFSEYDL